MIGIGGGEPPIELSRLCPPEPTVKFTSLTATSVDPVLTTLPCDWVVIGMSISLSVSISVVTPEETCVKLLEAEEGRVLVAAVPSLTPEALTPAAVGSSTSSAPRGVEVATGALMEGAFITGVMVYRPSHALRSHCILLPGCICTNGRRSCEFDRRRNSSCDCALRETSSLMVFDFAQSCRIDTAL